MSVRQLSLSLLIAVTAMVATSARGNEPLSRTPPAAYAERVVPLLTPLEQILATPVAGENDAIAQVLIDETVHIVAEDGRVFRVSQLAYRALKEAALQSLAEDLYSYGRDRQKFHLVRAVSIQPDGTEQAVATDAVIVQAPQRQANLAIYDDTVEVRVIYPRIPVGGVTHAITVVEDTDARMPGAYTSRRIWGSSWPTGLDRQVVELPGALAERLRWFHLGPDPVEPKRETLSDGRLRLSWQRTTIPPRTPEIARAPTNQVGPATHLTTLASWDEVAGWFQSLLAGRDTLSAELAAEADGWLRDVSDRDARIAVLFSKAADEIRYTSLALNDGDYQPQSCADVWSRRHGDCKDKSNFLVALLRHAGIPAHIALVNTTHLGFVDRRAPDYRVFTHAIVAIPEPGGGYLFCDPTSASGYPGVLSPSVTDRDALIVRDGRAEWGRIPPQSAGLLDYAFDLQLNADGEISGWLTLTADGIYGVWERERYRNQDHRDRRNALAGVVRGFFPGADVIDIVPPEPATKPVPAIAKAYFVVSGQTDAASGPAAVGFPKGENLLLNLGTTEARETAYFVYPERIRVAASFALPPGVSAENLPAVFKLESPVLASEARWRVEPGVLQARLDIDIRQNSLSPREFGRVYQGMLALRSWLAQPATLRANGAAEATAGAGGDTAIDLPLMPTGRGQLDLIEKRYPFSGDRKKRRAALQRAVQYFPNDPATAFEAGVYLAVLDWDEDRNQDALDRVTGLLAAHRRSVSPGLVAWGESLRGLALRDLGRTDEAAAIFTQIARDASLHPWRRTRDALNAIDVLSAKKPEAALALAKECAPLVSENQTMLLVRFARLAFARKEDADFREQLELIARAQPTELEGFLAHITKASLRWDGNDARDRWLAMVGTLAPTPGEELVSAIAEARAAASMLEVAAEIRKRLTAALNRPPLAAWFETTTVSAPATWDTYTAQRKKLADNNESDACTRLGLRALTTLDPGEGTLDYLWRVAADAEWHERRSPAAHAGALLPLLLDLCDLVPKSHGTYYEGRFLRAQVLARRGEREAENAIFNEMFADPQFPVSFRRSALVRHGLCKEHLGDYENALANYRELERHVADSSREADSVLRAVLINLHFDRTDEALRLIALLDKATDETLTEATNEYFIREFVALVKTGEAESFWKARAGWWPHWEKIAADLALPAPGRETVVPAIPELSVLAQNMRQAVKINDRAAYWRDFRTVVSAARWLPSLAPEISSILSEIQTFAPDQARALNELVLGQLAIPGPTEANARLRDFHVVATRHDMGDHDRVLAETAAYFAKHPDDTLQRPAIARVRAMSALAVRRDMAEASEELERLLAHPDAEGRRAMNVEFLAKLYRARGLMEEERDLLQRELANPHVLANSDTHRTLAERMESLGGSLKLSSHVRDWLAANPLPWYGYAEPASATDPRLRDFSAVLKNPERQFNAVETIKLQLLAAQNADLGLTDQSNALYEAVASLHNSLPLRAEAARLAGAFIEHEAFDEVTRSRVLWRVLVDAYFGDRREEFDQWKNHPLSVRYNAMQKGFFETMTRSHAFDFNDPAALDRFADELRSKDLDEKEIIQLQGILVAYVRLDELDRARALIDSISKWRYVPGYAGSRASNTLHFSRVLRSAEERAPVHQAMVERLRGHYTTFPVEPPGNYKARRVAPGALPELAPAEIRETGLWMIATRRVDRQEFDFWRRFVWSLHHDPATRPLSLELIQAAVKAAPEDDIRAEVLDALFYSVDTDEAETRERLLAIVAPYADPTEHPLTSRFIRAQNAHLAVRLGEVKDFEMSLRAFDGPDDGFERARTALKYYLQRGDTVSLKRTLRGLDAELLLHPGLLVYTVPALQRAGLKTEHRLAKETAEKELRGAILSAWVSASGFQIGRAVRLAEMLGRPGVFPEGWVESVTARCEDPMDRGRVLICDAWLREDWPTVAREAQAVLRDYPTFHRFHWYAGSALHRSGNIEEARKHLEIYVRYAHDELEHPVAVTLLAKNNP